MRETKPDYAAIARLRVALRGFDSATEKAARAAGLTPQRYLLLLMVKGAPTGDERATVKDLAERLRVEQHTVSGAAGRAAQAGLVVRERCDADARRTWIRLTPEGERRLHTAVAALDAQRDTLLETIEDVLADARAIGDTSRGRPSA